MMPDEYNRNGRKDRTREDAQKTWEIKMAEQRKFPEEIEDEKEETKPAAQCDEAKSGTSGTENVRTSSTHYRSPVVVTPPNGFLERSGHRIVGVTKNGGMMMVRKTGADSARGLDTSIDVGNVLIAPVVNNLAVSVKNSAYRANKLYLYNKYGFTKSIEAELGSCIKQINALGYGELRGNPYKMRIMLHEMQRKNADFLTAADQELFKKTDALLNARSLKSKRNFRRMKGTLVQKCMGYLRRCDAGIGMSLSLEVVRTIAAAFKTVYTAIMLGGRFSNFVREQQMKLLERKLDELKNKPVKKMEDVRKQAKLNHKKKKKEAKIKEYKKRKSRPRLRTRIKETIFSPFNAAKVKIFDAVRKKFMNSRLAQNKVSQFLIKIIGKTAGVFGKVMAIVSTIMSMLMVLLAIFVAIVLVILIVISILTSIIASFDATASDPEIRDAVFDEINKKYSEQQQTIETATESYRFVNLSNKEMKEKDTYALYPAVSDFYETTNAAEIMSMTMGRFGNDLASAGKKRVLEYVDALYNASHQVNITEYPYYDTDEDGNEILMYTDADIDVTTYYFPYIFNCNMNSENWDYPGQLLDSGMKFLAKTKGVVQGMCVAENYIVQAQNYNSSSCRVTVYNKSNGKKVSEQILGIGHGNSLTYNPQKKQIVCAEDGYIHIMDLNTGTGKVSLGKSFKIKGKAAGSYGIAYVSSKDMYYLRNGSTIYSCDTNFKNIKKAFRYKRTIRGQGMGSDGSNLYICGGADHQGVVYVYNLEGECFKTYKVNKIKELEEIDIDGDRMCIAAQGGGNAGIYYVTGQNSATSVSGGGLAKGNNAAEKVWNYFRSAGFTEEATAAILGNAYRESYYAKPSSWNYSSNAGGLWGMKEKYYHIQAKAKMQGKDWTDVQYQCDLLMSKFKSMKNLTWRTVYNFTYKGGRKCSLSEFASMKDLYAANAIFYCAIENSGYNSEIDKRYKLAKEAYEKYAGKSVTSSSTSSLSTSGVDYWVGGSLIRTISSVGRGVYSITDDDANYSWFRDTAKDSIEEKLKMRSDATFLINPGTDAVVHNSDSYIKLIKNLIKNHPEATFYVLSVVPVNEEKVAAKGQNNITNTQIDAFNKKLKSAFGKKYLDVNSYIKSTGYLTMSDGITYESGTASRVFNWVYQKVK